MYEVSCRQGLTVKFSSLNSATRYAIELQDSGVRRVSVCGLSNADLRLRALRAFLETRSDLIRQLQAIEDGTHGLPTTAAELRRRVAALDEVLTGSSAARVGSGPRRWCA
jgi:hypothetical protein